ncbi:MAG: hypothetical protein U9N55_09010 [candidate division Zixibacteria bacterium]|nr:hypothetical protein [candidate division Zixibacteria bacterium]
MIYDVYHDESKEWTFKVIEVDVPESEMPDIDLEQMLADMALDCWNRYKPTNLQDFESSEALPDAFMSNMKAKRRTARTKEQVDQNNESEA